jgi:hypothetical protein
MSEGKIELYDWETAEHKKPCCVCKENKKLMKITGQDNMCNLCGNEVIICRKCLEKFIELHKGTDKAFGDEVDDDMNEDVFVNVTKKGNITITTKKPKAAKKKVTP